MLGSGAVTGLLASINRRFLSATTIKMPKIALILPQKRYTILLGKYRGIISKFIFNNCPFTAINKSK